MVKRVGTQILDVVTRHAPLSPSCEMLNKGKSGLADRPAVMEVVAWAASDGDRSENADYQYGISCCPLVMDMA
jgi:hypothetical protein